jgi:signal transduction histidine kinase
VRLDSGDEHRLRVDDCGDGAINAAGLGLELVQRVVEQGLRGSFALSTRPGGGTRAEAVFPAVPR